MGRAALLLLGIWALGIVALVAVIHFESAVDDSRRAQVVIAEIRIEESRILYLVFDRLTVEASRAPGPEQTTARLIGAQDALTESVASLATLGRSDAPARIASLSHEYFRFIDHLSSLVTRGAQREAALDLGKSQAPMGIRTRLRAELDRADRQYGTLAARSRMVSVIAVVSAILALLIAFSIAFLRSTRARMRSHNEATTDLLTGLANRRRLFADMDDADGERDGRHVIVGLFDLDGFKAYNDTYGHPAGDALLSRLGQRLAAAVGDRGRAYRIGGDEFVVLAADTAEGAELLASAQTALSEHGEGFTIGCSLGISWITPDITLEDALRAADQRLYTNKRSIRDDLRSEVKDALLQVLAEQNGSIVAHLGHVAELAASTAATLGLTPEHVELTKLAAELHDVGKAAIPMSILNKPGPLDADERAFMERHTVIGERIVAAAPTLEAIAPIIRAAHERPDGTGYPDGLSLDEIPLPSRVIAVVDAFDAMTADRPYQQAIAAPAALAELRRCAGTQFDPAVVEAFATTLAAHTTSPVEPPEHSRAHAGRRPSVTPGARIVVRS